MVDRYQPEVAVVGDASTKEAAERYHAAATDIRDAYSDVEPVIVPKCREAFDVLDEATVLGWPNGYANTDPFDYSDLSDWRGRPVHILGGTPHSQHDVIDLLTQPTLDEQPPADIVGLDGNAIYKAAYYGEYWTPDGYESADHFSIRRTVRRSLEEIKGYWQDLDVWPTDTPIDRYGPAVLEPDEPVYLEHGGDIRSREDVERAHILEHDDRVYAFESAAGKRFVAYREGWE